MSRSSFIYFTPQRNNFEHSNCKSTGTKYLQPVGKNSKNVNKQERIYCNLDKFKVMRRKDNHYEFQNGVFATGESLNCRFGDKDPIGDQSHNKWRKLIDKLTSKYSESEANTICNNYGKKVSNNSRTTKDVSLTKYTTTYIPSIVTTEKLNTTFITPIIQTTIPTTTRITTMPTTEAVLETTTESIIIEATTIVPTTKVTDAINTYTTTNENQLTTMLNSITNLTTNEVSTGVGSSSTLTNTISASSPLVNTTLMNILSSASTSNTTIYMLDTTSMSAITTDLLNTTSKLNNTTFPAEFNSTYISSTYPYSRMTSTISKDISTRLNAEISSMSEEYPEELINGSLSRYCTCAASMLFVHPVMVMSMAAISIFSDYIFDKVANLLTYNKK